MSFVHLHVHTEYSLLDGSNKIKEYVKRVKEIGQTAAAITDHGVMYGVIDFYTAAKEAGINPVLGCEVYVAPGSRFDREATGSGDDRYYHLVLLAENNTGYDNLMKIVSRGFTEGFYYKPRIDMEILEEYHEGIIALSACLAGVIPKLILRGMYDDAKRKALEFQELFGKDNYFLELQNHGIPEQNAVNAALVRMSRETGIPLVCTNDVHYTYAGDAESHDLLLCIQTMKKVSDTDRMRYEGGQYYVKDEDEMRMLFGAFAPEALENTQKIADRCHVEITFHDTKLPRYQCPDGYTSVDYLRHLCEKGLEEHYPQNNGELTERLDYELSIIRQMGFVDYFLIVWDYINYCRENGISVGPGRGSAAGSLVAYCLHITNVDPIRYNLLFERFLNPERVSMPDIDVDFCYERRQEVIDYVSRKYGAEKVVQIITFGTLQAKGVIRDVARVLDLPYSFADSLAKMIPNDLGTTLRSALDMNPDLMKMYKEDEQVKYLIDMSLQLEGLPRNSSTHAAGVVICPEAAENYVPLARGVDGAATTQFTMTTIEKLGLLKMDFLGLRTLTVIQNAAKLAAISIGEDLSKDVGSFASEMDKFGGTPDEIKQHLITDGAGVKVLDMDAIDFDDPDVYELIASGRTEGIFQLESAGMTVFMKELKPRSLEDVTAGISLYRPGPMEFIPKYIEGKNNQGKITYPCPELEDILKPTYGCIVYQEQVMQIVRELAGYTMGQADEIRRAMSKKKQAVIDAEREHFVHGGDVDKDGEIVHIPGCVSRGIPENVANEIYDSMLDFAKYAFNKSHAACYAYVGYQTAWLKHYYPVEFMAALMTSCVDNTKKVAFYSQVSASMGIEILPPDINRGEAGFSVADGKVRFALTAIKGIGRALIDSIIQDRQESGAFSSFQNFIERMCARGRELNKKSLENLIKSGAFDTFNANRCQLMCVYAQILDSVQKSKKSGFAGQMSLFDLMDNDTKSSFQIQFPPVEEYPKEMLLGFEKEVMGIYVSGHPLEDYQGLLKKHATHSSGDFFFDEELHSAKVEDREAVTIGGIIVSKTIKYTKNKSTMAFITVEDLLGTVEVIIFPASYEKYKYQINEDAKVLVKGRASIEDERDAKIICDSVIPFEDIPKKMYLRFADESSYIKNKDALMDILSDYEGNDSLILFFADTKECRRLPKGSNVNACRGLQTALERILLPEDVRIVL